MDQHEDKNKILLLSDIHYSGRTAAAIIKEHRDCGAIIFLGDGEERFELAMAENGLDIDGGAVMEVYQVSGNCDRGSLEPSARLITVSGVKMCITHGHGFGVKSRNGVEGLAEYASANGCAIAVFGHTHKPFYDEIYGVKMFNPGAVQNGEYGIIMISNGEITAEHRKSV